MAITEQAQRVLLEGAKVRCLQEWDNMNDPPCHPSDEGWRGCYLCLNSTPAATAAQLRCAINSVITDDRLESLSDPESTQARLLLRWVREQIHAIASHIENPNHEHQSF